MTSITAAGHGAARADTAPPPSEMTRPELEALKQRELDRLRTSAPESYQAYQDYDAGRYIGGDTKPRGAVAAAGLVGFAGAFGAVGRVMARDGVSAFSVLGGALVAGLAGGAALGWLATQAFVSPRERRDADQLASDPALSRMMQLDAEIRDRTPSPNGRATGPIADNSIEVADRLLARWDDDADGVVRIDQPTTQAAVERSEAVRRSGARVTDNVPLLRSMDTDRSDDVSLAELRRWAGDQDRDIDDLGFVLRTQARQFDTLSQYLEHAGS